MNYEYNLSGKWLELLKQIAPSVKRGSCTAQSGCSFGPDIRLYPVCGASSRGGSGPRLMRDAGEIEQAVAAFARSGEWRL